MFIAFEGIDTCGKSTQIELLDKWLIEQGHETLITRTPGGSELGDIIRQMLLHSDIPINRPAEFFLFQACNAQLVGDTILPALNSGKTVLCDRFTLSMYVYQGIGNDIDRFTIDHNNGLSIYTTTPDLTFYIDIPYETYLDRLGNKKDTMEKKYFRKMKRLIEGYRQLASENKCAYCGPIITIDGTQSPEQVHEQIVNKINERMNNQ